MTNLTMEVEILGREGNREHGLYEGVAVRKIYSVLSIDDDPLMHGIYQNILSDQYRAEHQAAYRDIAMLGLPLERSYHLDTAMDGEEGLQKVEESANSGKPYALIYLDMRMGGLQTAERIRDIDPIVMIILITAYEDHNPVQARQCLGSNFELLRKPVDYSELLPLSEIFITHWQRTVNQASGVMDRVHTIDESTQQSASTLDVGRSIRVMFVDDSATVRAVYGQLLRDQGYEVVIAGGMSEALELTKHFIPDISILDYYMPGGNGDQLAQALQQQPSTSTTMIFVLTQATEVEEVMMKAGAVDVLYKDDPHDVFIQRVKMLERYLYSQISLRGAVEAQTNVQIQLAREQERSRAQANDARLRRQWLESIHKSMPDGLLVLNTEREIQQVNPAAQKLMKYSDEQLIGRVVDGFLKEGDENDMSTNYLLSRSGEHSIPEVQLYLPGLETLHVVDGVSDVWIEGVTGRRFALMLQGGGDTVISGKIHSLTLDKGGAGKLDASRLIANHISVSQHGTGESLLNPQRSIDGDNEGGELLLFGRNYAVSVNVRGEVNRVLNPVIR